MTPAAKAAMIADMIENARFCAREANKCERARNHDAARPWREAQNIWIDRINTFTLLNTETSND